MADNNKRIRVLVVDDSAFARKVLREVISAHAGMEVVGVARDGVDALEQIAVLRPDVVTLDLVMPELDGLGVLRTLATQPSAPPVIVVSMADGDSELGVAALTIGAFDLVHKPTALALDRLYELADELTGKIEQAAQNRPSRAVVESAPVVERPRVARVKHETQVVVVVGASTGGPQALTRFVGSLPADLPVPVVVVLHMPAGYTEALARRLNDDSALSVMEARDGLVIRPGLAVIARAGEHLLLEREGTELSVKLSLLPTGHAHRPAVDVLFQSAARSVGPGVLGVVLTGMGSDGREGSRAIREAGGRVLTEAESSCVVYGMPRSVVEAGLSDGSAPIEGMAALVQRRL